MFFKYTLALFVTAVFGPGVGHLFLGKYKKATVLLGLAVLCVVFMAIVVMSSTDISSLPKDYQLMKPYIKNLLAQNSQKFFIMDIPLAVIWAYAILDIARDAFFEFKKLKKKKR